ncbi:MAG: tRNA (adenosine(37)-N6)-threonylcarbamoyltransferase complex ATPase subunit type 1 TsaE [Phycisphaerae bacterium]|jgi:tRNA threonylcarbamoyladenosine biosynthesis protein TsaE
MDFELISKSADETIAMGNKLGSNLRGGEIIGLVGELGSGKTHLIKGIAAGAGDENQTSVSSPTFVIVNEYQGRLSIYHIDAYRLESIAEFEQIGFDDYCRPDSVVLLEWADKVLPALAGADLIIIELSHLSQSSRAIKISNAPQYLLKGV